MSRPKSALHLALASGKRPALRKSSKLSVDARRKETLKKIKLDSAGEYNDILLSRGLKKKNPFAKEYTQVKELGKGGFGQVFLGKRGDVEKVAVKVFQRSGFGMSTYAAVFESYLQEVNIFEFMKTLDIAEKRYVMDYVDMSYDDTNFYAVLEYIHGKDLKQLFLDTKDGLGDHVPLYLAMSLTALRGIHSKGLIHRDIKPENIMVRTKDNIVKLVDFGMATKQEHGLTGDVGTQGYKAPEINGKDVYTTEVDCFALGVSFLEVGLGKEIDKSQSIIDFGTLLGGLKNKELQSVLKILLNPKPGKRCDMKALEKQAYFVNYVKNVYPKPEVGGDVMDDDALLSAFWKDVASGRGLTL